MKKAVFILLAFIAVSCSKEPDPTTGDFQYQLNRDYSPVKVSFTSSGNGTAYAWDFGDNGSGIGATTEHLFEAPGTYTVKCSISGEGGIKEVTKTVNIPAKASKARVTKLTLKTWPAQSETGTNWDNLDGADLYYMANMEGATTAIYESLVVNNSIIGTNYSYTSNYDITDFSKKAEFRFYDDDTIDPDDFMGGIAVNLDYYRTGANAYPEVIPLTVAPFSFDLYITWVK